ncbi:sterol 3beta-glucosyltransferase [Kribbella aluminosa]|uniref:Sterol 3beta-glucosyltransferase n=1 Tax=Kribbella aluminosa TaxID=416017 RepID=A0ABS4UDD1_9ACTN|nr:glycosyltransferase [Kribbella aluminosa]MBP2349639.1 sterol 3beta-glucosyltransferase [Kribbella aluminosa]
MDVLILTHGTRGDVQPFVALATALISAGHSVRLGGPAASAGLAESYDVPFVALADGPNELYGDAAVREVLETNYRGLRGKRLAITVARRYRDKMDAVLDGMADVARQGADVIVHDIVLPGRQLGEWLGIPTIRVCLQPFWIPTRAFPNPMHALPLPAACNRLTYLTTNIWYQILAGHTRRWRARKLRLSRLGGYLDMLRMPGGGTTPLLQAFSSYLVAPEPGDYPPWVHTTGPWLLAAPPRWTPPAGLEEFLDADGPVIYVGFGSMAGLNPERTGAMIMEAVRRSGVRAVVGTGWGGIGISGTEERILPVREVPHGWLFDRVTAVVHHGGSGTTAAALSAGRPQVVCPFVLDQPFFARRIHELGAAPAPLPQRYLDAQKLADAIVCAVEDPAMTAAARAVGDRIRSDRSLDRAVRLIEEAARASRPTIRLTGSRGFGPAP